MNSAQNPPGSPKQGNTLPRVDEAHAPRLPHEHDESADSQGSEEPQAVMKQAHADVTRGLVDTDRSPQMTEVYKRTMKPVKRSTPKPKR